MIAIYNRDRRNADALGKLALNDRAKHGCSLSAVGQSVRCVLDVTATHDFAFGGQQRRTYVKIRVRRVSLRSGAFSRVPQLVLDVVSQFGHIIFPAAKLVVPVSVWSSYQARSLPASAEHASADRPRCRAKPCTTDR